MVLQKREYCDGIIWTELTGDLKNSMSFIMSFRIKKDKNRNLLLVLFLCVACTHSLNIKIDAAFGLKKEANLQVPKTRMLWQCNIVCNANVFIKQKMLFFFLSKSEFTY